MTRLFWLPVLLLAGCGSDSKPDPYSHGNVLYRVVHNGEITTVYVNEWLAIIGVFMFLGIVFALWDKN